MNDDQLLTRLRHDLDDFVGTPAAPPAAGAVAITPLVPRRSAWLPVAAAAAVAALVVGGLVILNRDDEIVPSDTGTTPVTTPATTIAPTQVAAPMPVPRTPAGWTVVEWGDVRLSLPPDLEPYGPGCTSEADDDITVVVTCGDRVITIVSGAAGQPDPDLPVTVRNGLSTALVPTPDLEDTSSQLLITETTSLVRFTGFSDDEIAAMTGTVGVSSVWRARLEPPPPVPDGWQTVDLPGFSFRVPSNWGTSTVAATEIDRDVCGVAGVFEGNVLVGRGSLDDPTVNCVGGQRLVPATDGVRVLPLDDGPSPLGNPFVSVTLDSVDPPQVVRVGLAGDGTIGRTIVGSIVETVEPATTVPITVPIPTAPLAAVPEYETLGTIVDAAGTGPWLCFEVLDSLPPQCGGGVPLLGWSWDRIGGEQQQNGTTWLDGVWVRGGYDAAVDPSLTVIDARPATEDDVVLLDSRRLGAQDFSVPCEPPAGGWPARRAEWPEDQVATILGYAGSWVDATQQVMTAKFTGDLDAATTAVQQYYPGAVCVVSAQRTAADLAAIADALRALSSVQVISTATVVDAAGERVEAWIVAPNAALQRSLDEQYGTGAVRLQAYLTPVD